MHWIAATDAKQNRKVFVNIAAARTLVSRPDGTVVTFDDDDAITVREGPEELLRRGEQLITEPVPEIGERMVE